MSVVLLKALKHNNNILAYRIKDTVSGERYDVSKEVLQKMSRVYNVKIISKPFLDVSTVVGVFVTVDEEVIRTVFEKIERNICGLRKGVDVAKDTTITKLKDNWDVMLTGLYDKYNEMFFEGRLRPDVRVFWSDRLTATAGICEYSMYDWTDANSFDVVIKLSIDYCKKYNTDNDIKNILLHEMLHVLFPGEGHNVRFITIMNILNKWYGLKISKYSKGRGSYRYVYTCIGCKKRYERYRALKELKVGSYLCGVCNNAIELTIIC